MREPWIKVWSKNKKQSLGFKRDGDLYYLTASKHHGKEGSNAIAMQALQKGDIVNLNLAHTLLGHPGKALFDQTIKLVGWKMTGKVKTCEACANAKAVA
jgi:hypothetical protein